MICIVVKVDQLMKLCDALAPKTMPPNWSKPRSKKWRRD